MYIESAVVQSVEKNFSFKVGDGGSSEPEIVGTRAAFSEGTGAGVGMESGGFEVVEGWAVAAAVVESEFEEEVFEASDSGLDGAVVGGGAGRREERRDAAGLQELLDFVGGEVRAVVGFEDQRRAVALEEHLQAVECDLGGSVAGGQGEELAVACQVADGQAPSVAFINGVEEFGEVDAPDAAWLVPLEAMQRLLVFEITIAAEGSEVAAQFGAGDIGEDEPEVGDADGGSQVLERVCDGGAGDVIGDSLRASASMGGGGLAWPFAPCGERAGIDGEASGGFQERHAASLDPSCECDGAVADVCFECADRTLSFRPKRSWMLITFKASLVDPVNVLSVFLATPLNRRISRYQSFFLLPSHRPASS